MLSPDDRDDIEEAIRQAVNDAYRLGIGAAIAAFEQFVDVTTDPQTLLQAIESARRMSVDCTTKDR